MTTQTYALPELKSDPRSGSGFSQIFDSGTIPRSEGKTQNPLGVASGTPDPVPPLICTHQWYARSGFWSPFRPDIWIFLDLDWILFPFQPDYPKEINCGHAKNLDME